MLTRFITAIVAIAIFFGVVYFIPPICFTVAVGLVAALAAYELAGRSGIVRNRAMSIFAAAFAFAVPFCINTESNFDYYIILVFLCFITMFATWLFSYGKVNLVMTLTSVFAGAILPVFFSLIIPIRWAENGDFLVLLPFLAAWVTDTGAYFSGVFLGKHKLCEKISPKKTVEGSIGGALVCVIVLVIYAKLTKLGIGYVASAIGALVLSAIAQIGDLSFSVIKREYNIKDYGNIMPGHGGVLDRFDSAVFTIPASYIFLKIIGGIL